MTKKEFIEKLERMKLNPNDFVILAGGSLLLRGLREETEDMDLACTFDLYMDFAWDKIEVNPDVMVEVSGNIGGYAYDILEGYKCQSLESILEMKKRLNRPKDHEDIRKIEEILKCE